MHSTDMSSEIRKNLSENLPIEEKSRLIIFMVKKYKCIIIWLFSVASISDFIYLILEKNSEGKFLEITQKYHNATRAIDFF
jgi:F0F1-type ATP synthase delta subunit